MTGGSWERTSLTAEQLLAREAAAGLLSDAFNDARAEARSILKHRLVDALLQEVSRLGEPAANPVPDGQLSSDDSDSTESARVSGGVYVYGFTLSDTQAAIGLSGVNGSVTSIIADDDVAAIVSDVAESSAEWGFGSTGDPDVEELGTRALEHQRVLEAVLARHPVLPMRFGTLYPTVEAVRRLLRAHYSTIHAAIRELEGMVELGLTVTWDRQPNQEVSGCEPARFSDGAGRGYLGRRGAEKAAAERLARSRRQVAAELHRTIEAEAAASVVHPTRHPSQRDDRESDVVLRASYLVETANRDCFEKVIVEALNARIDLGLQGDLTGPWPPYNFSRLELTEAES